MPVIRWCCFLVFLVLSGATGFAQAVPDTSLNNVALPDSLRDKKEAELIERTKVVPLVPATERAASSDAATTPEKKERYQPKPKKSALYSAIFPGLGQINNREYWKVPIVYAGVGVAGYFIITNTREYQRYRKAYVSRLSNPNYKDEFSEIYPNNPNLLTALKNNQDTYKKWLDMTYLYTGVGYILQVIDALAFAHLKNFDISQDLSLRFKPVTTPEGGGMGFVMHFK